MKRLHWLDIVRFIAVLSLILEHLYGAAYHNPDFRRHVSFSVELFVLAGGYASVLAFGKKGRGTAYVVIRLGRLLIPYAVATLLYHIFLAPKLDPVIFMRQLLTFSASGMFYFVLFYAQLILISGFLFRLMHRKHVWFQLLVLVFTVIISYASMRWIIFPGAYGAGRFLLGGSYLFLFVLGVFLGERLGRLSRRQVRVLGLVGVAVLVLFEALGTFRLPLESPPALHQQLLALVIFFLVFAGEVWFPGLYGKAWLGAARFIGKSSLTIYLYHYLALLAGSYFVLAHPLFIPVYKEFLFALAIALPLLLQQAMTFLFIIASGQEV